MEKDNQKIPKVLTQAMLVTTLDDFIVKIEQRVHILMS